METIGVRISRKGDYKRSKTAAKRHHNKRKKRSTAIAMPNVNHHYQQHIEEKPVLDSNNNKATDESQFVRIVSESYENDKNEIMQIKDDDQNELVNDTYHHYKYGASIPRVGKVFSYTFWRTKVHSDVFWSIQGNNEMEGAIGGIWIATQFFGNPAIAGRFRQEIVLTHPTERNIQMHYVSSLEDGRNCICISKAIVHHFRHDDNSIDFEFRIVRRKTHRHRKKQSTSVL